MSKATSNQLDALHGILANTLTKHLTRTYSDPETGEELPPPAHIVNAALKMLKDNGIVSESVQGSPLDFLKGAVLPFNAMKDAYEERRKA